MTMTYVQKIEPRLTPHRAVRPATAASVLAEWCLDLEQELSARLELVTAQDLSWQPHRDSNSAAVTAWHVIRWMDFLGTRAFTGAPASQDGWHTQGWRDVTDYEPDGLGYAGLGTLTGYTPEEMRAVPIMDSNALSSYLSTSIARLVEQITILGSDVLNPVGGQGLSPYQTIGSALQGSFGHVGEIDTLVALRARSAPG